MLHCAEQKLSQQMKQQQNGGERWPPPPVLPSQAYLVTSPCPPSAYDSAGSGDRGDARSESLPQSTSSIKERDYIGLAEVSSAPPAEEAQDAARVLMMEPDLRLGLGLPNPNPAEKACEFKECASAASSHASDAVFAHDRAMPRSSIALHCPSLKILPNAMPSARCNGQPSPARLGFFKSSTKRPYEEAMTHAPQNLAMAVTSTRFHTIDSRSSSSLPLLKSETQAAEAKLSASGARILPWHCQNDSETILYQAKAGPNSMPLSGGAKGEGHSTFDLVFRRDGANMQSYVRQDNSSEEAEPPKGQMVGWPPVRSYRRSAVAAFMKPDGHEGVIHPSIFVKVNMDGSPIGRKVDLSAYKSYDGLLSALENMFQKLSGGHGPQSLNCADFVLTYEDKEGDWMLVGDVPWELFVKTVRRLRITRGSDMAGGSSVLAATKLL